MKPPFTILFITAARPQVDDVDTFAVPSKPAGVKYAPGATIYLFPHGDDFWTLPLYHN